MIHSFGRKLQAEAGASSGSGSFKRLLSNYFNRFKPRVTIEIDE